MDYEDDRSPLQSCHTVTRVHQDDTGYISFFYIIIIILNIKYVNKPYIIQS